MFLGFQMHRLSVDEEMYKVHILLWNSLLFDFDFHFFQQAEALFRWSHFVFGLSDVSLLVGASIMADYFSITEAHLHTLSDKTNTNKILWQDKYK